MKNLKKLTILHSNDLHGDFMARDVDAQLTGGVSMLSGYVNQVRKEEKNVIYAIAGDMFRGSIIDNEYKGISTIEIMNMLTPDVATLGNHEVDYGIAHLLFLERCARFPIINANIYIKTNHVRLFRSHVILEVDGMKVLFIGILTEEVLAQTRQEELIGALVDVRAAAEEIGKICDSYRSVDIDFTVLLTHIGLDADRELAKILDPDWGVDLIIGGHSHSLMAQPEMVAGIPIVQAASGTGQIGRFDIMVDTDRNTIDTYTWELVPIDEAHCPRDLALEKVLGRYKEETDEKYNRYITRFADVYTHPCRNRETEIGRIFTDIMKDSLGVDLMLLGSGSFRKEELGPILDFRDLVEMFPYDGKVYGIEITGEELLSMLRHIFRREALVPGAHTEFYQFSRGISFVVNVKTGELREVHFLGEEIDPKRLFRVGVQDFHFINMKENLGLDPQVVKARRKPKVIASSIMNVVDEYLSQTELVKVPTDCRWLTIDG